MRQMSGRAYIYERLKNFFGQVSLLWQWSESAGTSTLIDFSVVALINQPAELCAMLNKRDRDINDCRP